jgi:hypothetical protein
MSAPADGQTPAASPRPAASKTGSGKLITPWPAAEVRSRVLEDARERKLTDAGLAQVTQLWEQAAGLDNPTAVWDTALGSWELAIPELAGFTKSCEVVHPAALERLDAIIAQTADDRFIEQNLRGYLGRMLAEQRQYDEALSRLTGLDVAVLIDPATVLFYRAVAAHEILEIPEATTALADLLDNTQDVPPRYATVAELMRTELTGLEAQSLDEVARLMSDSERRLDLGRTGEQVQGVQDRIVSQLDELIKKLEAQQGGGGGGNGSGNANQSSSPAEDSTIKGSTAPGETDDKTFRKEGNWGDLPPKEQAAAKNLINREFPSHYRQAIETYFKKLANRPATPP